MSKPTIYTWRWVLHDLETRISIRERRPTLSRMRQALRRLGLTRDFLNRKTKGDLRKIIIVAGTNGKGTVAATLAHLLSSAGYRTGLFTSPHLVSVTERIQIGGKRISKEKFRKAYCHIVRVTEGLNLGHFEILTLLAVFLFFPKQGPSVDYALLEVGIGGLWDPTNAVPHYSSVITKIGFDHEKLLGKTLKKIAFNKLGIVPHVPKKERERLLVVHHRFPYEVEPLKERVRRTRGGRWVETVPFGLTVKKTKTGPVFFSETPWGQAPLALPGFRGAENTTLALTVFSELGFDPENYLSRLSQVSWPGRMEKVKLSGYSIPVFLSGDHNAQGMESLVELLKYYQWKNLYLLVAVAHDRNPKEIFKPLLTLPRTRIFLTEISSRGTPVATLRTWARRFAGSWRQPLEAMDAIMKSATKRDLIVVTGSLYLVGKMKEREKRIP